MIRLGISLLLFASLSQLQAQIPQPLSSVELWNWFFWEAVDTGKFRVRGVAQIRSQPHRDTFLRAQGGPILEWQVDKKWNLIAGYYYQAFHLNANDPELRGAHRPFVGFEYAVRSRGVLAETRHLLEHFKALNGPDSTRVRSRLRFELPLPLNPFAQNEVFYDRLGVQANRSEAGIDVKVAGPVSLQLSLFHEIRPPRTGGSRTVFSTRFTFDGPWQKSR